jgi:beta-fructofuranosidase
VSYSSAQHSFTVDGKETALRIGDIPALHAYVDASVIEVILGQRIGYTKRFYYDGAMAPKIAVTVTGSSGLRLQAWNVSPISPNRLT